MAQLIPTFQSQSADFTQTLELGGQLVELRLVWNIRAEFWFIHSFRMLNFEGNEIYGIKCVKAFPLFHIHKALLPDFQGDFITVKVDEAAENQITYDNFGAGWGLYYITEDELDEWENLNGLE